MPTIRRNIRVGDDLSGKTIYVNFDGLDLTSWKTGIFIECTNSMERNRYINIGEKYNYQHTPEKGYELYIERGLDLTILAKFFYDTGLDIIYSSYQLPDDFGVVTYIDFSNNKYSSITADFEEEEIPIYYNNTQLKKIIYNNTEVSSLYYNGVKVY